MADRALADEYRRAWPQLLGSLVRSYGRVELAEDCLQEACVRALTTPDLRDPVAWIATTAKRLMLDEFRREEVRVRKAPLLVVAAGDGPGRASATGDDRLDLLVLACHPALPAASRMPLALRFVLGTPTEEIADAFLVGHTAMSARLTRAKRRLDAEGRRFEPPSPAQRDEVLHVVSVLYTLGHTALTGDSLGRPGDRATALELARAAARAWPDSTEATALVALLLLTEARAPGRTDRAGRPTSLREADRTTWHRELLDEGLGLAAAVLPTMGRLALQAGIAGLHSSAATWEATDWAAIERLYARLIERWPSPGARISRAVAIGYGSAGADAGLAELAMIAAGDGASARQHAAARADLLRLAGRTHEAKAAYLEARALERNTVVQDYLSTQAAKLKPRGTVDTVDGDRQPVRVRREPPPFRRARVEAVSPRSPRMARVVLGGPELDGFTVDGPASSIRVLLPDGDGGLALPRWTGNEFVAGDGTRALIRTFTPQFVDGHLAIDVVLHDHGRAARWAATAGVGEEVAVSGPGRTDPIVAGARAYLLGGDESAIPAIGQLLEALPPTTDVDVRIELARPDARIALPEHPNARVTWLDADPQAEPGDALATSIEGADGLPEAIWLAGEAAAIQRLRRHLFDVRGRSRATVIARGYWKRAREAATDVPAAEPAGTFPP